MTDYLAKYGREVTSNGYRIVPVRKGTKAPLGLDWTQNAIDASSIEHVLTVGYTHDQWLDKATKTRDTRTWKVGGNGIGVLCADNPAVDIDCHDDVVAAHMIRFTEDLLGTTICRVGLPPKSLLLYRAETPFSKVNSNEYLDRQGRKAKLEVLGTGQQFVALSIHPDTGRPYKWRDKKGVHNTPLADLPIINVDQANAIRAEFERIAVERNWDLIQDSKRSLVSTGVRDRDDPFADVANKVSGVSDDEIARLLMLVPGYESYNSWIEIGMALFHQYDGSDHGRALWEEWSEQWTGYDAAAAGAIETHWSSFDVDGKGRQPITARVILNRAFEIEKVQIEENLSNAIEALMKAANPNDLDAIAKKYKSVPFSSVDRTRLVGTLQLRYKDLTRIPLPKAKAEQMLHYEDPDRVERFSWCSDWVYVQADDCFDNLKTGQSLTPKTFDGTFSREMLSRVDILEGKTVPDQLPQYVARNVVQVPLVADRMYMPGFGRTFRINGRDYVNRYNDHNVPAMPEKWSSEGRHAVDLVERHAEHLIANKRDRDLFLDVLSYVVQTGERVSWGVFMQGTEGDGKTFWGQLMAAVLGMENAPIIRGAELKEKFTGWAEGGLFLTVEEVRLSGEHRYDAVNNIKPYLSNGRVPIRRMQRDIYQIINRTTYFLTSNYKDGLPATESTRYLVLFSRWQSKEKISAWNAAHPRYFTDLYSALDEAGSLRKWLFERKLSPEFNPKGRAPDTSSLLEMQGAIVDDDTAALRRVIETSSDLDFSPVLLDSTLIPDRLAGEAVSPQGKRLAQILNQLGLSRLGETGFGGRTRRWWSSEPERFRETGTDGLTRMDPEAIKNWLTPDL